MKEWIRANTVLALGVALPVVLVLFFAMASVVPRLLVDPPRTDLLFYSREYLPSQCCEYRFRILDGRLHVDARAGTRQSYVQVFRLYRFTAGTLSTSEIPLPEVPAGENEDRWQAVEVKEVAGLRMDSSELSPDGYQIGTGRRSGGILMELFSHRRDGTGLVMTRNGRTIVIPASSPWRGYNGADFLGWVVGED